MSEEILASACGLVVGDFLGVILSAVVFIGKGFIPCTTVRIVE